MSESKSTSTSNMRLKAARLRMESPGNPGSCLSRQELADLVAAYVHRHYGTVVAPDKSWVSKLERGKVTWPRPMYREALRAVLAVPSDEALGFYNRRRPALERAGGHDDGRPPGFETAAALDEIPPPPVPRRVGVTEVRQLHDAAAACVAWDHAYGSGPTRAAILGQLRWAAGLLAAVVPDHLRSRLHSAVGWLSQVCAMVAFDAYAHADARRIFRLGLACAEEAGDGHLRAKVLSSMARQAIWVGDADQGLTWAEHGLARSDRLTPTERAMLHTARARALAKMGRRQATLDAVGQADEAFADSNPADDPPWMAYYDRAQHHGDTGHALWDLTINGHPTTAAERLTTAVERHSAAYARSRAISQTKLASLLMATGDPHEAATIGTAALEAAGTIRSRRLAEDLRELSRRARPHRRLGDVDELRQHIAIAVAAV